MKHDVPVTLAIVAAMVVLARLARVGEAANAVVEPPSRDALAVAGAACGVAFSTHYYAIFLALPLVLAIDSGLGAFGGSPGSPRPSLAALATACAWAGLGAAVRSSRCRRSCSSSRGRRGRTSSPTVRSSSTAPSPPAAGRSRARAPTRGCSGRKALGWPVLVAAASGWSCSPGGGPGRRSCWRRSRSPSCFHQQHGRGQPLSEPGLPVPGRVRRRPALALPGPLDAADGDPRSSLLAAPAGLHSRQLGRVLPADRHPDARAARHRAARPARRHGPGPALLRQLTQSRESLVEALDRHPRRPAAGLDQVRPPAGPRSLPVPGLPHPLSGRRRPRRRQDLRQPRASRRARAPRVRNARSPGRARAAERLGCSMWC